MRVRLDRMYCEFYMYVRQQLAVTQGASVISSVTKVPDIALAWIN